MAGGGRPDPGILLQAWPNPLRAGVRAARLRSERTAGQPPGQANDYLLWGMAAVLTPVVIGGPGSPGPRQPGYRAGFHE